MHRQSLLSLLDDYRRCYPAEVTMVDRYVDFVTNHSDCFQRSLSIGHVTGSAWLVNQAGSHVLLTHHRKLDIWVQLGGHADGQSDVFAVARQEADEESGIVALKAVSPAIFDLDIHLIPARNNEPEHYHYDARFAFQTTDSDQFSISDESHALAWVEIARLGEKTQEDSMLRMADKWLTMSN